MKYQKLLPLLALGAFAPPAHAAITGYAEYNLGEAGSLGANNLPQDSSGNGRNFVSNINGSTTASVTGGASPAAGINGVAGTSTDWLNTGINAGTGSTGGEGWYSTNLFSTLPTDNFAFGIFAKASVNDATTQGAVFSLGGSNGAFNFSLESTGWQASAFGIAYIGGAGTFTADTWVSLAVIRSAGVSTFYVNGVQVGSTYAGAPVNDTAHLSVTPGGTKYFDGGLDQARVLTFTAGESSANILNALQVGVTPVPEPSAYGIAAAGSLAAAAFVRRRRKSV